MGTRKKTKERLGGCQAARAVVWRARRRGARGVRGRRAPADRRMNITALSGRGRPMRQRVAGVAAAERACA